MKLIINFPVNPSEHSTHLRRGLVKLFHKLGLRPKINNQNQEWTRLEIEEDITKRTTHFEQLVDEIFDQM